jgi:chromosomal replication initiation ATPase DnaA
VEDIMYEMNLSVHAEKQYKAEVLFKIIEEVTGIDKSTILSKDRHKDIAMTRNIAGYMLNQEIGMTTIAAAEVLERDHSTIVYYSRVFNDNYTYWRDFKTTYDIIAQYFWVEFTKGEQNQIDLQIKSLESLIQKLKDKTEYLLTKNI